MASRLHQHFFRNLQKNLDTIFEVAHNAGDFETHFVSFPYVLRLNLQLSFAH